MTQPLTTIKVTSRGQLSLPAPARHRWNLNEGGEVGAIDLGDCVVIMPGGVDEIRRAFAVAVSDGAYEAAVADIDDPDLITQ